MADNQIDIIPICSCGSQEWESYGWTLTCSICDNKIHYQTSNCEQEIFSNGSTIVALLGGSVFLELWVTKLAELSGSRLDWHYSGGVGNVLHLGDEMSITRVKQAILKIKPTSYVEILNTRGQLYRAGDPVPDGTLGVAL